MQINAFIRNRIGKKANKRLRNNTIIPAIIFGGNKKNLLIALDKEKIWNFIKQENFFSSIIHIIINNKKEKVVIRDIQRHPFKNLINHIDFVRINENKRINVLVKIKLLGKEDCKGVKKEGGLIFLHKNYIRINCLPKYIPKFIEINVSNLSLGQTVALKHISKTKNLLFLEKNHNQKILTIQRAMQ